MSEIIKFNLEETRKGNFAQVKEAIKEVVNGKAKDNNQLLYAIDAAAQNPEFLEKFQQGFSRNFGQSFKFRTLTADEIALQESMVKFDTTQSTIAATIGTTILPTVEHLIKSTDFLAEINIQHVQKNEFYEMFDFHSEQVGATLTEVAAGSDEDEVLRRGDLLIPNNKAQASFKLSEFAINTMDGYLLGKYLARLVNRVKSVLISSVLYGGNGVANGTAKAGVRGIKNNYGVNATGDLSGTIGAITYSTFGALDTAITTAGGVAPTDAYDRVVKAKELLLPANLTDVEENQYIYVVNRATWGAVSTIQDLNGRYKAQIATDPTTGKAIRMVDGTKVIIDPRIAASEVFLFPGNFYTLIIFGDIINLNDGGLVQLREGLTSLVSRAWIDGSMEYAQKFLPTTAVTVGTTVPDNADQNAFRVFKIA